MGKVRRQRKKFHLEAKNSHIETKPDEPLQPIQELTIKPQDNLFAGLTITIDNLKKNLNDDTRSVKSFKSLKSESGKILSKKDKLKLRREMLMEKFEIMYKEKQLQKKKKPIVGDLNPLKDALPSLESLLKNRNNFTYKSTQPKKKRGIEKNKILKKKQLEGVKVFQQILKSKLYQKDPQMAITQHVQAVLQHEKSNNK